MRKVGAGQKKAERQERFHHVLEVETIQNFDDLRILFEGTGNPLYMWKAVAEWSVLNDARISAGFDRSPLPEFCLQSLGIYARRLRDLAEGFDYKETPEPFGELPRTQESVKRARGRKQMINPPQAIKAALHALDLKRTGWNAFKHARRVEQKDEDALTLETYREIGRLGYGAALELLVDDHAGTTGSELKKPQLIDSRSVRKRIAGSKDARRPKPKPP